MCFAELMPICSHRTTVLCPPWFFLVFLPTGDIAMELVEKPNSGRFGLCVPTGPSLSLPSSHRDAENTLLAAMLE
jgi:hypothetical protein